MTLQEIDRLEPNGSTALHAACRYGHFDVVRVLLEKGADRSIENCFHCLPFDEASNIRVKELFDRIPTANRYVNNQGSIEWEVFAEDIIETAQQEKHLIRVSYDSMSPKKMLQKIFKNYVEEGLKNIERIKQIYCFFEKAVTEQDPLWIIKAYTAETDFYKVLNAEIAGGATCYQSERRYIITLLRCHPKLDSCAHRSKCYRAVLMTSYQLERYKIGAQLMTKAFVSSSIDQKVVELFIAERLEADRKMLGSVSHEQMGSTKKTWVIMIYDVKQHRTAIHIENATQYAVEGEVLILPYSTFKVTQIAEVEVSYLPGKPKVMKIELAEISE